ncbi:MAG: NADH-quinone oxidoreductase subunit C [Anaerolineaceae bacterium]|nr:NADH-quinone oxidoreductase subunit C [Anaerolineaceae bacterium]
MDTDTALQNARQLLEGFASEIQQPELNRLDFVIPVESLLKVVEVLKSNHWGYLSFITGLDCPAAEGAEAAGGKLEVLYHFAESAAVVTLRIRLPYDRAEVPSLCTLIPSVSIYERELMEMFGIQVIGTPDPRRLLLPDDWPDGVYPLRKSYQGFGSTSAEPQVEI